MGCGFSAGDKLASEEDRILDSAPDNNSVNNNTTTGMGGGHSKTKASKRKSNNGTISELTSDKKFQNGKTPHRKTTSTLSGFPASPFNIQSEVSTSQVNFFKMLDEKIENGVELEEQDSEHERQVRLQRVAEEWDNLLGRSQDSHDLQQKQPEMISSDEHEEQILDASSPKKTQDESLDSNNSMKTLFSNSVSLPVGTFREIESNAPSSKPASDF